MDSALKNSNSNLADLSGHLVSLCVFNFAEEQIFELGQGMRDNESIKILGAQHISLLGCVWSFISSELSVAWAHSYHVVCSCNFASPHVPRDLT